MRIGQLFAGSLTLSLFGSRCSFTSTFDGASLSLIYGCEDASLSLATYDATSYIDGQVLATRDRSSR
ncbi:hypothetical protein PROFUN_04252 [Planoprotostelium fungivorum]|uniref:Uncharacterized protein n=1 Tax=Planoprotostelium fungivorum TaxID=1890364 RepID=A0A2P6NV88_9EUKA|nr:hypothetical protein PROFUN_04252 [Planoprotostelium fungivorum]